MIFDTGKSKLVIDLDSCEGIYVKKNGKECKLEDYIYKLVLLALIRQREEETELKKKMLMLFGFDDNED